jgi:hypothetical protein
MKNGILYIAFDMNKKADYLKEVKYSAKTMKEMHPDLDITLYTDKVTSIANFDNIEVWRFDNERVKQEYLYFSPYDNTLYLDCDTSVVGSIKSLFKLMDRFDIAAVHDHVRVKKDRNKTWTAYANVPESFPEFAGGVIIFKKSNIVENFFTIWQQNYRIWYELTGKINDQPSFRVSLWECDKLKVYVLPPEYNVRTQSKRDKFDNISYRIYHWHDQFKPSTIGTPQKF